MEDVMKKRCLKRFVISDFILCGISVLSLKISGLFFFVICAGIFTFYYFGEVVIIYTEDSKGEKEL